MMMITILITAAIRTLPPVLIPCLVHDTVRTLSDSTNFFISFRDIITCTNCIISTSTLTSGTTSRSGCRRRRFTTFILIAAVMVVVVVTMLLLLLMMMMMM